MHPLIPVTAVIELSFAPVATIGDWAVRLETVGLAAVLLISLLLAVLIAWRTPVDPRLPTADEGIEGEEPNHLRADDLLCIAVAAVPGAVAGGRAGYALLHLDYYRANPGALLDISQGGLQLSLAVVGGTLTAVLIALLLGTRVGRWMHALILPLLFAIAAGKAAQILGGDGQGVPFDGAWATAYAGPGPWGSLGPQIPSHPAQAYEAIATAGVLVVMIGLLAAGAFRRRLGGAFLLGIALWLVARAVVATTWRDPAVLGSLNADQVISIVVAVVALIGLAATWLPGVWGRRATRATTREDARLDWPDPETRPRF